MSIAPPLHPREPERQAALNALGQLDTPIQACLERLTRQARRQFRARFSNVSLIDRDRQWFKSIEGLEATQTPRDDSFCGHAILQPDVMVVEDATRHELFADNTLVTGSPHIRFYAGAPIRTASGSPVGVFCVVDDKPREFTREDRQRLREFAIAARHYLEMTRPDGPERDWIEQTTPAQRRAMIDEQTRVWGRDALSQIGALMFASTPSALVLVRIAADAGHAMPAAVARLVDVMRDFDVVGRLDERTLGALIPDCPTQDAAMFIAERVARDMIREPQHPGDAPAPDEAMPFATAAVFVPRGGAISFDDAMESAERQLDRTRDAA